MTINENNYIGARNTLVGYAATDPRYPAYDKDGSRGYMEVPVAINEGYKKGDEYVQTGTTWYQVTAHENEVNNLGITKGAKIRVDDAKQEVREYKSKDGTDKLGITLSYGQITVLEPGNGGQNTNTQSSDDWNDSEAPF